jgi:hypothetical protein
MKATQYYVLCTLPVLLLTKL